MQKELTLSVHQLVDFLLRTGDIDNRVFNRSTMSEGSRLHSAFQDQQTSDYVPEYPLKRTFYVDEVSITLEGRADGVIKKKNGEFLIDEIKTTVMDLDEFREQNNEWHLGQAKCYALMFALEQNLDSIGVRMTYIRQGKEKDKLFEHHYFLRSELENFVLDLLDEYIQFYNIVFRAVEKRNASIKELEFPFPSYRRGQKELMKCVFVIAKNGGKFFAEAPTGIGKTMSTIFPSIKAMENDEQAKLFYLTAKTSGKEMAYSAIELLKENGLSLNDIVLTAKEKICFCPDKECNPDSCPFARNYYGKIQAVLRYCLMNYTTFDYSTIVRVAEENQLCPFELQLDLSLFCDAIICDYNYLFDPISYLKRYFDTDSSHVIALVDEAHNLIDRSRDMYSSSISYSTFLKAKKSMRKIKNLKIKRYLTKINNLFEEFVTVYGPGNHPVENFKDSEYNLLMNFINCYQDVNKDDKDAITRELTDFYLDVNRFIRISELFNSHYIAYYSLVDDDDVSMKLFCVDASGFLRRIEDNLKGTVMFSATLSPIEYYVDTLGGDKETDPTLILSSPFPRKNFKVLVAPKVSVKYKDRESSYREVVEYIKHFIKNKVGNYFIYSPSYAYMEKLLACFDYEDADIYVQDKEMNERDKEAFLNNFKSSPERTALGFLVVGGSFGEGIDLVDDRLIGAVVIGIGMPKINFESDCVSSYYKEQEKPGYEYAYINPGMNKVMQAVGRVIRSEEDRGAVILIDERYMRYSYQSLFKTEWKHYEVVFYPEEVSDKLKEFFKH